MAYLTYTGQKVTPEGGSPILEDIAWQLLHVCRYAGACRVNYTVGIHSMLVADFVVQMGYPLFEFPALLHDGTESCVGDIPKPFKSNEMRGIEDILEARIWKHFELPMPSPYAHRIIKEADIRALCAEASLIGPPGLVEDGIKNAWYEHREDDIQRLKEYLSKYKVHAWGIHEGDLAQWDFVARARRCLEYNRTHVLSEERKCSTVVA